MREAERRGSNERAIGRGRAGIFRDSPRELGMTDGTDHGEMMVLPIGTISTPFEGIDDPPQQGIHREVAGELTIYDRYAMGIDGLDVGSEVDVVWFAHLSNRETLRTRGRGVFSTRSPDRPNPICVTRCTIDSIDGRTVAVRGVDMVDGTPLLDLKAPMK